MNKYSLNLEQLTDYRIYLKQEEKAEGTIEKYMRDVSRFIIWLDGRPLTKDIIVEWKERLLSLGYARTTINSMLASLNGFFRFSGLENLKIKFFKIQRRLFRDEKRELSRTEYERLLKTAQYMNRERLALIIETICSTGIRVSELRYITVEAAEKLRAEIFLKGKARVILLPHKLCRKLLKYARKQKKTCGEIFVTKNGKTLSRRQVWAEMKSLCKMAEIEKTKVFPHNLRHLFAVLFYRTFKDIVLLADLMGHSSIETTRIYLAASGEEHIKRLECMGLVS